jgi:tetratricopeptide (TPR) repeat protein
VIRLTLEVRANTLSVSGALSEERPLSARDLETLQGLGRRYRAVCARRGPEGATRRELIELGQALGQWLDGPAQWLRRWLMAPGRAREPELEVRAHFDADAGSQALLYAPWELLAAPDPREARSEPGFLAAWSPPLVVVRTLLESAESGAPPERPAPRHALTVLFMAAAPEGQTVLDYEDEERAILSATQQLPLDLLVEETGTAADLGRRFASLTSGMAGAGEASPVQVVHLSCHGTLSPRPGLVLEDDSGGPALTSAQELRSALGVHALPDLVVLSACMSASSHADGPEPVEPMVLDLLRHWAPAVLGFADSVADVEASCFAALLYRELAEGPSIETAVAWARQQLLSGVLRRRPSPALAAPVPLGARAGTQAAGASEALPLEQLVEGIARRGSRDWHLARLMLRRGAGGPVACSRAARRLLRRLPQEFLDADQRVPVAGYERFVGRRRELQQALRVLTATEPPSGGPLPIRGVLIHGVGRLGKSSLAARLVQRLVDHVPAVVFGDYSERGILSAIRSALKSAAPEWLRDDRGDDLEPMLLRLLRGPCLDRVQGRPLLLVLDDLERVLEADPSKDSPGRHRVRAEHVAPLRAVLRAFATAATSQSQLIVTSRFAATLPDVDGTDLMQVLWPLPLPGMQEHDARKQAHAVGQAPLMGTRGERCIHASQGNPGLLSVLLTLAAEDAKSCDQALTQMDALRDEGAAPSHDRLREFLEQVAVTALVRLLTPAEQALLRASMAFEIPLPDAVVEPLCRALALPRNLDPQRLVDLGVWERHRDPVKPQQSAFLASALVRPWVTAGAGQNGHLSEQERELVARAVLPELGRAWASLDARRWSPVAHQCLDLSLAAGDAAEAERFGAAGLRWLEQVGRSKEASRKAEATMTLLGQAGPGAPLHLLRACADLSELAGRVEPAAEWRKWAMQQVEDPAKAALFGEEDRAAVFIDQARALVGLGHPDEARALFEQALGWLDADRFARERAVTLGDIARIRVSKGEVEEALRLHQEMLAVFEKLGDAAGQANTLWSLGRIAVQRQNWAGAFDFLTRSYGVLLRIGRVDGISVVGVDFGKLLAAAGQQEQARTVLSRSHQGFLKLGQQAAALQVLALMNELGLEI